VETIAPHLVKPPNGDELAQFLLARLGEDEAAAQAALRTTASGVWVGKELVPGTITIYDRRGRRIGVLNGSHPEPVISHLLEKNAPYYVSVDTGAKRAVVEMWLAARDQDDVVQEETLLPVLLQLAARYHQHADFQHRSWRVA
jgi:hypothetical protein